MCVCVREKARPTGSASSGGMEAQAHGILSLRSYSTNDVKVIFFSLEHGLRANFKSFSLLNHFYSSILHSVNHHKTCWLSPPSTVVNGVDFIRVPSSNIIDCSQLGFCLSLCKHSAVGFFPLPLSTSFSFFSLSLAKISFFVV